MGACVGVAVGATAAGAGVGVVIGAGAIVGAGAGGLFGAACTAFCGCAGLDDAGRDPVLWLGTALFGTTCDAGVGLATSVAVRATVGLASNSIASVVSGVAVALPDDAAVADPQPAIRNASSAIQAILCFKICHLVSR